MARRKGRIVSVDVWWEVVFAPKGGGRALVLYGGTDYALVVEKLAEHGERLCDAAGRVCLCRCETVKREVAS